MKRVRVPADASDVALTMDFERQGLRKRRLCGVLGAKRGQVHFLPGSLGATLSRLVCRRRGPLADTRRFTKEDPDDASLIFGSASGVRSDPRGAGIRERGGTR